MTVDCEAVVLDNFDDVREWATWDHAQTLSTVWMVLLSLYFALPMALMWVRRGLFPVNLRPVLLVQMVAIGIMLLATTTIGRDAVRPANFPCDALLWSRTMLVPLIFGPHLLIMANMLARVQLAQAMQSFRIGAEELRLDELIQKLRATGWRRQLQLMSLVNLPALLLIGIGYRKPYYGNGCRGCDREVEEEIVIGVFALVMFVVGIALNRRLQQHEDPLGLRAEATRVSWVSLSCGVLFFVMGLFKELNDASRSGYFNYIWFIVLAGMYAHFVYCIRPLYRSFLKKNQAIQVQAQRRTQLARKRNAARGKSKPNFAKAGIINSSSQETSGEGEGTGSGTGTGTGVRASDDDMTLAEVLATKEGVELFQHYLASEFNLENILFWKAAKEWKRMYPEMPSETARDAVAQNIFLAFIPDGAPMQINLRSANRQKLIEAFHFKASMSDFAAPKAANIWDDAIEEIFNLMEADAFQRFRDTQTYKDMNAQL